MKSTTKCTHRHRLGAKCCLEDGHEGGHLYRCAAPGCQGLTWPPSLSSPHFGCADLRIHPVAAPIDEVA